METFVYISAGSFLIIAGLLIGVVLVSILRGNRNAGGDAYEAEQDEEEIAALRAGEPILRYRGENAAIVLEKMKRLEEIESKPIEKRLRELESIMSRKLKAAADLIEDQGKEIEKLETRITAAFEAIENLKPVAPAPAAAHSGSGFPWGGRWNEPATAAEVLAARNHMTQTQRMIEDIKKNLEAKIILLDQKYSSSVSRNSVQIKVLADEVHTLVEILESFRQAIPLRPKPLHGTGTGDGSGFPDIPKIIYQQMPQEWDSPNCSGSGIRQVQFGDAEKITGKKVNKAGLLDAFIQDVAIGVQNDSSPSIGSPETPDITSGCGISSGE